MNAWLLDKCRHRVEAVEAFGIRNQLRPLRLEHLPDRLLAQLRMAMRHGIRDAVPCSASRRSHTNPRSARLRNPDQLRRGER